MKKVTIDCTGYQIAADLYEQDQDKVLLVLPGFTSSKQNYKPLVEAIIERTNTSALVIDYSGHGESPFDIQDITITENFSEVVRAYDWLRQQYPDTPIDVMGTSYGGYFAAKLATVREVRKLIMRVPANYDPKDLYTPWRELDQEQIRNVYRVDPNNFTKHPVLDAAQNFKGQAYLLTHELDEACPRPCTDPFAAAFKAEAWEAKGFMHGFGATKPSPQQMNEYQDKLGEWLNS